MRISRSIPFAVLAALTIGHSDAHAAPALSLPASLWSADKTPIHLRAPHQTAWTFDAFRFGEPSDRELTETQWKVSDSVSLKLEIRESGIYKLTKADLDAAGFSAGNPNNLKLYSGGQEVSIFVTGQSDGTLDSDDAIYFYGQASTSNDDPGALYYLVSGQEKGRRVDVSRDTQATPVSTIRTSSVHAPKSNYFAALKNNGGDKLFGPVISSTPISETLRVINPVENASNSLTVSLQGVSDGKHAVTVRANGNVIGTMKFVGREAPKVSLAMPEALEAGDQTITLQSSADSDIVLLDRIELSYEQTPTAVNGELLLRAGKGSAISVGGFTTEEASAWDITDPHKPVLMTHRVVAAGNGTKVLFETERMGNVLVTENFRTPHSIWLNQPSAAHAQPGADLIIITDAMFAPSLEPLRAARAAEGWSVSVVDMEDVADEFGFGSRSPQAIHRFLKHAHNHWDQRPTHVLLVGDASYDGRQILVNERTNIVPSMLFEGEFFETASDGLLADFNGDAIPELAVGRFPVRTIEQADALVLKTLRFNPEEMLARDMLFASGPGKDEEGEYDFDTGMSGVHGAMDTDARKFFVSAEQDGEAFVRSSLQGEYGLVAYMGHGSATGWTGIDGNIAEEVSSDPAPVFINITCMNGYFHDIYGDSLAEKLLYAPTGATAVWASSSLVYPEPQEAMGKAMMSVYGTRSLGDVGRVGQDASRDPEVRMTYNLFGDPTLFGSPNAGLTPLSLDEDLLGGAGSMPESSSSGSCAVTTGALGTSKSGGFVVLGLAMAGLAASRRRKEG